MSLDPSAEGRARELAAAVASGCDALGMTGVRVRASLLDEPPVFLHAEERALVEHAVPSRQSEFGTARRLAHELLAPLVERSRPLLPGSRRAPQWPEGVVGSISHSRELALVAVARQATCPGVGLDLEPDLALGESLVEVVLTARERDLCARSSGGLEAWSRLVFSAKESAYKAWSSTLQGVPEFEDVELEFGPAGSPGRFRARLRAGPASGSRARELDGAFGRASGHVWTVALLPGEA